MMTTSRRSSVGARHCSTYARKIAPFIGPSITKGATIPSWRSPTTRVMVFQWPWGTDPTNRSPRGQRRRSLTRLVLVAVSSMNTNLAGSSRPCLRIQRCRARATSARSCSVARRLFFDGDIMSLEKSPDRGATAWNSLLAHRRNDFVQGQIRLLGDQSQQPFHVLLQRRRAPAAQLCSGVSGVTPALQPPHRQGGASASLSPMRPVPRTVASSSSRSDTLVRLEAPKRVAVESLKHFRWHHHESQPWPCRKLACGSPG